MYNLYNNKPLLKRLYLLKGVSKISSAWRSGVTEITTPSVAPDSHPKFSHVALPPSRDDLELTVVRRVIPDDVKRAIGFEPLPDGGDLKGWQ